MKEISFAYSKVKANRYGKWPRFSNEVPVPFHGSLNEMPPRFIPAIICLTKLRNEQITVTTNPIDDEGSKTTLFASMPKKVLAGDGLQNLSPEDWPPTILDSPLPMRPSINGFTRRPLISFCPWCGEPIANANTEGTPGNTKNPIFLRESRSKSVPKQFSSALTLAIGKPIPSVAVKVTRRSKLPWSAKPDMQSWLNSKPKLHEP